jgi:ATP-dependent DNA helicase RecG
MKFKESEILELKSSTSELEEAIIAICAILNKHRKGELYFGIKNNGDVVGQDVSDKTLRDISKSISDHIEPKIYPYINSINIENKPCVHVTFEGKNIPYFADGRAYIRVGTENKQLTAHELKRFILNNNKPMWESQFSEKNIKDINAKTLKDYIFKANTAKRIDFEFTNAEAVLRKLCLIKNEKLLKAAEVLFCDDNSLEVQAAIFASKEKLTFLDIQQFKGNLFELLKKSEAYIKEHMNWRAELLTEGRKEIPEIPLRALTEALVNSFCHRDFFAPESNKIAIYKDRVEIYNPGQFPEGFTPEDFIKKEEQSILRNPLIANILFLSKDIEKWGSGLKRIYEECRTNNVKVEFAKLKSGFSIIFYRKESPLQRTPQISPQISPQIPTELEQKILNLIKEKSKISRTNIAKMLSLSEDTIKEYIERLKQKGLLKRVGSDRGGHWEVIENKEVKNEI